LSLDREVRTRFAHGLAVLAAITPLWPAADWRDLIVVFALVVRPARQCSICTAAQKQTICESVTKTQKNNPEPTGFRAAVGATVPPSIALVPAPDTIAKLMPQTRGLEVGRVEGQVMLLRSEKQIAQEP
jgi:hypothetical protein